MELHLLDPFGWRSKKIISEVVRESLPNTLLRLKKLNAFQSLMLKKASFKIVVAFKYGKNSRLRSYDHRFSHVQNSSHAAMNGLLCRSLGHMASFLVGTVMA